ncbi:MAG: hypothetical protein ACKPKO_04250, partial [Candidatus Fonsibacter sp.]
SALEGCMRTPGMGTTTLARDWNVRLHARGDGEEDVIGQRVYGRGEEYFTQLTTESRDNRDRMVQLMTAHQQVEMNSPFQKPYDKQITYREPGAPNKPTNDPAKYNVLDRIMTATVWKQLHQGRSGISQPRRQ